MAFWKKKQKRQTAAKKKSSAAPVKPKSEYKPPTWEPTIKKAENIQKSESRKTNDKKADYKKEFLQTFNKLTYHHRSWIFGEILLLCLRALYLIRQTKCIMMNAKKDICVSSKSIIKRNRICFQN